MATVQNSSTDRDKAVENKTEDKPREVTADNITNKELVSLLWVHFGSPNGSPDEWLKANQDNTAV